MVSTEVPAVLSSLPVCRIVVGFRLSECRRAWEPVPCRMSKHNTVLFSEMLDIYAIVVYFRKRKDLNKAAYYRIYSSGQNKFSGSA